MSTNANITIAVTGATGQLGRLVIDQLLQRGSAGKIVAIVRHPSKASDLAARGVEVRGADYGDAAALERALSGVDRLLLISSSEVGRRLEQHRNVIAAAKAAGVRLLAYTSLLHADSSPLSLAPEHVGTEQAIRESGLPFVILRNGWYAENYLGFAGMAVANGVFIGGAGEGRVSIAPRADYAAAAVAVLTGAAEPGRVYELAGDQSVTLSELAAEIARQSGKPVIYQNLTQSEHADRLKAIGLSAPLAEGLASWDADASRGALFDDGRALSRLIGRPTTPLADAVRAALST